MLKAEIETYCFEILDIEILMAYLKEKGFLGFSLEKKIEKNDVIQGLYKLSQKNIINIENDNIIIQEKYKKILNDIRNTKGVFVIESTNKKVKKKCCYFGERILVSEESDIRKNQIIFYYLEQEDFWRMLKEDGYLFEYKTQHEEHSIEKIEVDNIQDFFVNIDFLTKFGFYKNGTCKKEIYLKEEGLDEFLYIYENEEIYRRIYDNRTFVKIMESMIQGEEV